jgi:hypothetical protein
VHVHDEPSPVALHDEEGNQSMSATHPEDVFEARMLNVEMVEQRGKGGVGPETPWTLEPLHHLLM